MNNNQFNIIDDRRGSFQNSNYYHPDKERLPNTQDKTNNLALIIYVFEKLSTILGHCTDPKNYFQGTNKFVCRYQGMTDGEGYLSGVKMLQKLVPRYWPNKNI